MAGLGDSHLEVQVSGGVPALLSTGLHLARWGEHGALGHEGARLGQRKEDRRAGPKPLLVSPRPLGTSPQLGCDTQRRAVPCRWRPKHRSMDRAEKGEDTMVGTVPGKETPSLRQGLECRGRLSHTRPHMGEDRCVSFRPPGGQTGTGVFSDLSARGNITGNDNDGG